jgi:hemoglobin
MSEHSSPLRPSVDDAREMFPVEAIERLVHQFYTEIRSDPVVGPVFAARIVDWTPHLDRMVCFWRSILRAEPTFKPDSVGGPPAKHRAIAELSRDHFSRWLELFSATAHEVFEEAAADYVVDRANRIGTALSSHLPPRSTVEAGP